MGNTILLHAQIVIRSLITKNKDVNLIKELNGLKETIDKICYDYFVDDYENESSGEISDESSCESSD